MKLYLFLIAFILSVIGYSQDFTEISYSYTVNGNSGVRSLIYSEDGAIFFERKVSRDTVAGSLLNMSPNKMDKEKDPKISVEYFDVPLDESKKEVAVNLKNRNIVYIDRRKDSLFFTAFNLSNRELYKAAGPLPDMKWIITDEKKTIAGYPSQKATTTFKCRDYVVWFTKELPLPYGPWKLHGLPGIILEVKESNNFLTVRIKDIKKGNPDEFLEQLDYLNKTHHSMSIEESNEFQKTMQVEFAKKILKDMNIPSNGKVTVKAHKTTYDLCGPQGAVIRVN